ncbi:zinc finger protein 124-like isoform X2 [Thrips palmi]|nr:zinc finger protein 124-like isoform X2 [Thrips palmi]
MCIDCLSKLDLFKEFQEQCQRTDAVLKEHLHAFLAAKEQQGNFIESDAEVQKPNISSEAILETNHIEESVCDSGTEFSTQIQELNLPTKLEDSITLNKPRSGKRRNKKVKSLDPADQKQFENNDNQENNIGFEDNEYKWPGSLSDEELERHNGLNESKTQDCNNPDAIGNQKRKSKVYECEYCGRTFTRSNHLAQHELTHTKDEPFHCYYCNKGFWYKNSLIGHIKQNHTGDVNYTCEECGRGFFQRSEFMRHKPIHSNETPFKCEECGMTFKLMKNLKRHQKVHTAARTHTCQYCGKSFRMLQTLRVHLITHTGEKPFKCTHCGKGFSQSAPLKAHIRSLHTGEKPYPCEMCGESFPTGNALKSHIFKHTGIHPYSCNACSVVFKRKKDLTDHRNAVHGGFITSPVKVPPKLPLHEVCIQDEDQDEVQDAVQDEADTFADEVDTQEVASNASLNHLSDLHDQLSSPVPMEPLLKLEPTTPQRIDVQQHIMLSGDDSFSEDSMSVSTLPPLPLSLLQQSSPISSPLMSPSSEDLLPTDLTLTFS